jgi:hypothetical protein
VINVRGVKEAVFRQEPVQSSSRHAALKDPRTTAVRGELESPVAQTPHDALRLHGRALAWQDPMGWDPGRAPVPAQEQQVPDRGGVPEVG